ncbi:MAG: aminoacyl-tRNA hydrolase [Hungatella sp.]|jgi:PTH1 family peptidyl-tRNA hydrolase|nr:aminoacyl-tRNA hydrolase [Hungatella sp.]
MYIIVGLGNPGEKYVHTRHNVGFEVIDILADRIGIHVDEKKHKGLCGRGVLEGQKVVLVKPQTFMNLSGESVRAVADFYKVAADEIIVVYDDISLEPGRLRVRGKGSAGGHNGIKNIIAHLGTQEFPRVKVGIGEKPKGMDLADYVLSHFGRGEWEQMEEAFKEAADAVAVMISQGTEAAMNRFNGEKKEGVKGQNE